jgi:hypothetical protein
VIRNAQHHHDLAFVKIDSRVYDLLTRDAGFLRAFHRPFKINHIYDVPYLCGYSKDARMRYVDREFWPHRIMPSGFDTLRSLMIHESSEKALEDRFGLEYQLAHHIATHLEFLCVHAEGENWRTYCKYLSPYIKEVGHEDIRRPPPDLDLEPYQDENDKRDLAALMSRGRRARVVEDVVKRYLGELDLTTQRHKYLNRELWDGEKLLPDVREKLLAFAHAWANFAKIPPELIQDVWFLGGSAGYNWTPFSDLDVHVVVDRSKLGGDRDLIDDYLQTKKKYWAQAHKIRIKGYPVEPYAQDVTEQPKVGQGVYSLVRDDWVQKPTWEIPDYRADNAFAAKLDSYVSQIDDLIGRDAPESEFEDLKQRLKDMRTAGVSLGGEFSEGNFLFKELRNRGYLDKLSNFGRTRQDASLSL